MLQMNKVIKRVVYLGMVKLYYVNGKYMGDAVIQDDGYYAFYPIESGGYWNEMSLRYVADQLEALNKKWNDKLEKEL